MTKYPEHEKLRKIRDKSQAIGEFLDNLTTQGFYLCTLHKGRGFGPGGEFFPVTTPVQEILADYFEIDLNKLEDEKRALLAECRSLHHEETRDRA